MTEPNERHHAEPGNDAQARVAEITRLFVSIRGVLDHMIGTLGTPDGDTPKTVVTKLNELHTAHLRVLAAEEAFHDQKARPGGIDAIDFDSIRAEIGSQLDRLREGMAAEGLSGKSDR